DRLAGKIDKHLLARSVRLTEHDVERYGPLPVPDTELRVLIPARRRALVFDPEQLQGHALAPQLPMHLRPVRLRACATRTALLATIQQRFQCLVVQRRRQGPTQPRRLRSTD